MEAAVRVELRVIPQKIELFVPERSAGRIQIEHLHAFGWFPAGSSAFVRVEFHGEIAVPEWRGLQLSQEVVFGEQPQVRRRLGHGAIPSSTFGRMSIRMLLCETMRYF